MKTKTDFGILRHKYTYCMWNVTPFLRYKFALRVAVKLVIKDSERCRNLNALDTLTAYL